MIEAKKSRNSGQTLIFKVVVQIMPFRFIVVRAKG